MFLLNILEAVLAYDLVKIRFMKEKEVILNGITNDKSRGIQLIEPGYLQKVIKGVNWLLSPILLMLPPTYLYGGTDKTEPVLIYHVVSFSTGPYCPWNILVWDHYQKEKAKHWEIQLWKCWSWSPWTWRLTGIETWCNLRLCIQSEWIEDLSDLTWQYSEIEPVYDKTNKMTFEPSEDSDQPGHPPIFAVRMKKAWVLSYPLSAQRILWIYRADAWADLSRACLFVSFVMGWLICIFKVVLFNYYAFCI